MSLIFIIPKQNIRENGNDEYAKETTTRQKDRQQSGPPIYFCVLATIINIKCTPDRS